MNVRSVTLAIGLLGIAACSEPPPPVENTTEFNIDSARISVSGVSAGAYMAGQYHLAHSSDVSGAGLIAGGPYWCANGSINLALGPCMNGGAIDLAALAEYAATQSKQGAIDSLDNLDGDRVWVFHGANDAIVHPDVSAASAGFYSTVADGAKVTTITDADVPHGMPTVVGDGACDEVATPFLNNCEYDAAGELLKSITGIANDRTDQPGGELISVTQVGGADAGMLDEALLFVPDACAAGESCGVHIVYHGCQQSTEFVDKAFATRAGFNEWAATNNLLVLYPQVAKSSVAPMNPLGCWDWWGYTGEDYATANGPQIKVVKALVDSLSGTAR